MGPLDELRHPPRIPDETRQEAHRRAEAALSAQERQKADDAVENASSAERAVVAVDAAVDVFWRKLVGDARDRTAHVLTAARGLLEAEGSHPDNVSAKRRGLERALDELDHPAAWPAGATGPRGRS